MDSRARFSKAIIFAASLVFAASPHTRGASAVAAGEQFGGAGTDTGRPTHLSITGSFASPFGPAYFPGFVTKSTSNIHLTPGSVVVDSYSLVSESIPTLIVTKQFLSKAASISRPSPRPFAFIRFA